MKYRNGFIANSSTSSFLVLSVTTLDEKAICKDLGMQTTTESRYSNDTRIKIHKGLMKQNEEYKKVCDKYYPNEFDKGMSEDTPFIWGHSGYVTFGTAVCEFGDCCENTGLEEFKRRMKTSEDFLEEIRPILEKYRKEDWDIRIDIIENFG
jgi:hypothetical protein